MFKKNIFTNNILRKICFLKRYPNDVKLNLFLKCLPANNVMVWYYGYISYKYFNIYILFSEFLFIKK